MLQTIPKWRVTVTFSQGESASASMQVFWIHDHFLSNVLRQVAMMSFSKLDQPTQISVVAE